MRVKDLLSLLAEAGKINDGELEVLIESPDTGAEYGVGPLSVVIQVGQAPYIRLVTEPIKTTKDDYPKGERY